MAKAQLGSHPDLQKEIDAGMKDAERRFTAGERAHALRGVIDNVRAKLNPNPKKAEEKKPPLPSPEKKPTEAKPTEKKPTETKTATLWERLGGETNVRKVVNDFVTAAANDPKVDFDRGGKYKLDAAAVAHLKQLLVEQISSVSGGPLKYSGRDMKEVHKGMGITDEQFDALAAHLKKALEMNNAKPADVDAVMRVVGSTRKDIVEKKAPEPKLDDKKDTTKPKPDSTPPKDKTEPKPDTNPSKDKTEPKPGGNPPKDSKNAKPDK
jgi:hemoglobin